MHDPDEYHHWHMEGHHAEYIKQAEQLPQAVAEAEKKAMAENEETKLNVKLKEIMENTMVSEPAAE